LLVVAVMIAKKTKGPKTKGAIQVAHPVRRILCPQRGQASADLASGPLHDGQGLTLMKKLD
jgi:hypothetical protein